MLNFFIFVLLWLWHEFFEPTNETLVESQGSPIIIEGKLENWTYGTSKAGSMRDTCMSFTQTPIVSMRKMKILLNYDPLPKMKDRFFGVLGIFGEIESWWSEVQPRPASSYLIICIEHILTCHASLWEYTALQRVYIGQI